MDESLPVCTAVFALLDDHCSKLLLMAFVSYVSFACVCKLTSLWCEAALRRNRASLPQMHARPGQAVSVATAAQVTRFRNSVYFSHPCRYAIGAHS